MWHSVGNAGRTPGGLEVPRCSRLFLFCTGADGRARVQGESVFIFCGAHTLPNSSRGVSHGPSSFGVHADRAAGGDRHHRHPHRPAPAGRAESPRGRRPHAVQQQPEAARPGLPQPPRPVRHAAVRRPALVDGPDLRAAGDRHGPEPDRGGGRADGREGAAGRLGLPDPAVHRAGQPLPRGRGRHHRRPDGAGPRGGDQDVLLPDPPGAGGVHARHLVVPAEQWLRRHRHPRADRLRRVHRQQQQRQRGDGPHLQPRPRGQHSRHQAAGRDPVRRHHRRVDEHSGERRQEASAERLQLPGGRQRGVLIRVGPRRGAADRPGPAARRRQPG